MSRDLIHWGLVILRSLDVCYVQLGMGDTGNSNGNISSLVIGVCMVVFNVIVMM